MGRSGNSLTTTRLKQTRRSLSEIRAIYRFKGERGTTAPSKINYKFVKNRAGYLAAFGERHAYLSYLHLKKVSSLSPNSVPQSHGRRNELVVTSIGAGACIELYGLCQFYLEHYQQHFYLKLNSIEKERSWVPNRHIVFSRILKSTFPKLNIDPIDIDADLTGDAISVLSAYYDQLIETDILLIYNVMNEIPTAYARKVWRNIKFLLNIFQKPVLVLFMEPSAEKAEPRVRWLKELLTHETELIDTCKEELFNFDASPVHICMDSKNKCLNYRLFGTRIQGSKPEFETTLSRSHFAAVHKPNSPIPMEQIAAQLSKLEIKRGKRGTFLHRISRIGQQSTFKSIDPKWEG